MRCILILVCSSYLFLACCKPNKNIVVLNGQRYTKVFCEGRLVYLKQHKPHKISEGLEDSLQAHLQAWVDFHNDCIRKRGYNKKYVVKRPAFLLKDSTVYEYSLIDEQSQLFHYYVTHVPMPIGKLSSIKLFFLLNDKGKVMDGYKIDGWSPGLCEDIEEKFQTVYDDYDYGWCLR